MTLDELTPASVHSLWSSPKYFNRLCLTVFSNLWSSLLLVHIFLPNFFLPVNFAFIVLLYSTPWTVSPFSNDSVTYPVCEGCQWSSSGPLPSQQCSPLLLLKRTRVTQIFIVFIIIIYNLSQYDIGNGSNQDYTALQTVVRLAEHISGSALPSLQDIYLKCCKSRAAKIIKDSNHPGNRLFILLPSGKRFRSMMAKTERLRRSFFPQAIRLLNSNS